MGQLIDIITGFAVPAVCEVCGRELVRGERCLCMHCMASLPYCHDDRTLLRLHRLPVRLRWCISTPFSPISTTTSPPY